MPKENKANLKRTARISVRPCCFNNLRTSSLLYQPFLPPSDYTSGPLPTSPISTSPISPTHHNSDLLTTPRSTPPPLTSLHQPLPKLSLKLDDLPPSTTNPPPPRPSFDTIKRMANAPPPIPPIDTTFPLPTPNLEPPIPSF
ncbi:hypothetical protein Tco_1181695 [Tanacetum coccineum]